MLFRLPFMKIFLIKGSETWIAVNFHPSVWTLRSSSLVFLLSCGHLSIISASSFLACHPVDHSCMKSSWPRTDQAVLLPLGYFLVPFQAPPLHSMGFWGNMRVVLVAWLANLPISLFHHLFLFSLSLSFPIFLVFHSPFSPLPPASCNTPIYSFPCFKFNPYVFLKLISSLNVWFLFPVAYLIFLFKCLTDNLN